MKDTLETHLKYAIPNNRANKIQNIQVCGLDLHVANNFQINEKMIQFRSTLGYSV